MVSRSIFRLRDMKDSIAQMHLLLRDKTMEDLLTDRVVRAAFERFLEVMSEASRHIPEPWLDEHPKVPWRKVADLGNHLRHAYHKTDYEVLWNIYEFELGAVEEAIDAPLAKHS